MKNTRTLETGRMVGMAILAAIVVVLTLVATFVRFGTIPITLTLIPIVVGAALYGPMAGAGLGAVFGLMTLFFCINGADPGGNALWLANPALTALLCLIKGAAAGLVAGIMYKFFAAKSKARGVVYAAIASPMVNTGIFLLGMAFGFHETLVAWAAGESIFYYALIGLAGVNFLLELIVNIVLSSAVVRIIEAAGKDLYRR